MINDDMLDDERAEARLLLTKVIGSEPALSLRPASLLRRARRRAAWTQGAAAGGVAVGVVAVVAGASTVLGTGPDGSGSVVGTASSATSPSDGVKVCIVGEPGCPEPGSTEDDRSRALTEAVQGAQSDFIPPGLTARPRPGSLTGADTEAFKFVKPNHLDLEYPYYATAAVGDAQGAGTVILDVGNTGGGGTCDSLDQSKEEVVGGDPPLKIVEFESCVDQTLSDGTVAAVSTYRGVNAAGYTARKGYRKIVVDAVRPDGTRLHLLSDNHSTEPGTGIDPTRPAPPLDAESLLKLATILKY